MASQASSRKWRRSLVAARSSMTVRSRRSSSRTSGSNTLPAILKPGTGHGSADGSSPSRWRRKARPARTSAASSGESLTRATNAANGLTSVGIDVNPLAAFVARVKLSPLDAADVRAGRAFLRHVDGELPSAEPWPVPGLRIAGKVFEPDVLDELLRLRTVIEERAATKERRHFLLLAWLAILQDVGSYFKEGNGIKYRNRQRRPGGYVARPDGQWQLERFGVDQEAFVRAAFRAKLAEMLADVPAWHRGNWSGQRVIEGNSLEETGQLGAGSFDSVVFSPRSE